MIIYVSDFDLRGSGYCNIGVNLCTELVDKGYEVMALGIGYDRREHHHPFKIVPVRAFIDIPHMIYQLSLVFNIECVIVALDIPHQETLLNHKFEFPYIGLFPLEAGPLCGPWAISLLRMDARLIMSKFGQKELELAGVDSTFIPIGVTLEDWQPPSPEMKQALRQGLDVDDKKVVLTVADNQERKNLSRAMEIVAGLNDPNVFYWLVTRPDSPVGWKLEDYAMQMGIFDTMTIWKRGMPQKELWKLYACADAFLLTSKAEGLAIPVLEAMAMKIPVVGTDCTAIQEHCTNGRGFGIPPSYIHIDPWGNSQRYMADLDIGVSTLQAVLYSDPYYQALHNAAQYVRERTWQKAGQILIDTIKRVTNGKKKTSTETT